MKTQENDSKMVLLPFDVNNDMGYTILCQLDGV